MSRLSGENKTDFIVALRQLDEEEDSVTLFPQYLVVGAPEDTSVTEMKKILEKAGEYDSSQWRECRVIPSDQWDTQKNWSPGETNALGTDNTWEWAFNILYGEELLQCVNEPAEHGTTYDELVSRFNDEKRITLRLPWSMHVSLDRASKAKGQTLNSFCIQKLAEAINYEALEEFEALRRKPGRPKKVQDSE